MEFLHSLSFGDIFIFAVAVVVFFCGIRFGISIINHWATNKALDDWKRMNPKAAIVFNTIEDGGNRSNASKDITA